VDNGKSAMSAGRTATRCRPFPAPAALGTVRTPVLRPGAVFVVSRALVDHEGPDASAGESSACRAGNFMINKTHAFEA
jgi:hypothetical protein